MDETALYWARAPNKTLSTERVSGQKSTKKHITLAVCANADGSEKLKLLFINNAKAPRSFRYIETAEGKCRHLTWDPTSHVYWEWNKKAWMNGVVFQSYFTRLNSHFRSQGRQVTAAEFRLQSNCTVVSEINAGFNTLGQCIIPCTRWCRCSGNSRP